MVFACEPCARGSRVSQKNAKAGLRPVARVRSSNPGPHSPKFYFTVNPKTAKVLALSSPPGTLTTTDEGIE